MGELLKYFFIFLKIVWPVMSYRHCIIKVEVAHG